MRVQEVSHCFGLLLWLMNARLVSGQEPTEFMTCEMSFYVTQMTEFDVSKSSFYSVYLVSGECNLPYVYAIDIIEPLRLSSELLKSGEGRSVQADNTTFSGITIFSHFRHTFDLRNFPFDEQSLVLNFRGQFDSTRLRLTVNEKSRLTHTQFINQRGFELVDTKREVESVRWESTFGLNEEDPALVDGGISIDEIKLTFVFRRTDRISFLRGTFILLAAVFTALLLSTLSIDQKFDARASGTVGVFFAITIAFLALDRTDYLKMIDIIHILGAFVVVALLINMFFLSTGIGAIEQAVDAEAETEAEHRAEARAKMWSAASGSGESCGSGNEVDAAEQEAAEDEEAAARYEDLKTDLTGLCRTYDHIFSLVAFLMFVVGFGSIVGVASQRGTRLLT
uniref:Lipid/polyisoprenoid-binding YceI-like domain-containing protein n=1 Tax=Chromera velia CCMP2878 TaxID=1169474 RepID=A0A0G4IFA3_9ALVE|eukprot:Cvel_2460.t1-p1 / transcript=Cvel_2460.t1 / gene=Cvel_2460 / organism=Chromera_velia_CCMP2878 / gene_product=hypothetical protein / transcript_product=hypothetical protein / location=Cvel_scaffold96:119992-122286(+) / protein_length=394 / sequence_SO=supercontig / SO=protein_coding / is_pseudo=false